MFGLLVYQGFTVVIAGQDIGCQLDAIIHERHLLSLDDIFALKIEVGILGGGHQAEGFELAAKMGALFEPQFDGHALDGNTGSEHGTRGDDPLFIEPVLWSAVQGALKIAL